GATAARPPPTTNQGDFSSRPLSSHQLDRSGPALKNSPRGLDNFDCPRICCTSTTSTVGEPVPAFQVNITTGSVTPIYRQIVDQVRLAAATGDLAAGDTMPSVRSLADRLGVNANTVVKAYAELVRDGVLDSRQGLGFFVAEKRQIFSKAER